MSDINRPYYRWLVRARSLKTPLNYKLGKLPRQLSVVLVGSSNMKYIDVFGILRRDLLDQ